MNIYLKKVITLDNINNILNYLTMNNLTNIKLDKIEDFIKYFISIEHNTSYNIVSMIIRQSITILNATYDIYQNVSTNIKTVNDIILILYINYYLNSKINYNLDNMKKISFVQFTNNPKLDIEIKEKIKKEIEYIINIKRYINNFDYKIIKEYYTIYFDISLIDLEKINIFSDYLLSIYYDKNYDNKYLFEYMIVKLLIKYLILEINGSYSRQYKKYIGLLYFYYFYNIKK